MRAAQGTADAMIRSNRQRRRIHVGLRLPLLIAILGLGSGPGSNHSARADDAGNGTQIQGPTPSCNDVASVLRRIAPPESPIDPEVQALMARFRSGDREVNRQASQG